MKRKIKAKPKADQAGKVKPTKSTKTYGSGHRFNETSKIGEGQRFSRTERARLEKAKLQRTYYAAQSEKTKLSLADVEFIVGDMHEPRNQPRRDKCKHDLEAYLREYYPQHYTRPFSGEHKRFIGQLQESMMESMWLVKSVFRGFGKTTLTEDAASWAVSYGHKRFLYIVAASAPMADSILTTIQTEFEQNPLIHDDFPEITLAVRALEGKYQRAATQLFRGELTNIRWGGGRLIFPKTLPNSPSAGSIVTSSGWGGGIRGARHRLADGSLIRPDFVMIDDPQDDEMAESPTTCRKFLDVLQGTILGLGGHNKRISVVMPATIIKPGDAVDQLMDAKEYPAWIAENVPMLEIEPPDQELWLGEYARIRADYDRGDPMAQRRAWAKATEFYQTHHVEMDRGAVATWEHCYQEDEISAIQHAMNIKIDRGADYFAAECQGRPNQKLGSGALVTSSDFITSKISGTPERTVSPVHQLVTGFVDVGHDKLNWMLTAWTPTMTGTVVGYGEYPEGTRKLTDAEPRLTAAVFAGLIAVVENMASTPLICVTPTAGEPVGVSTVLIDCGDPTTREIVFQVARSRRFPCRVMASRGRAHHQYYPGDPKKKRHLQNAFVDVWKRLGVVIVHDACLWRERCQRAFMLPQGSQGGIDIYGTGRDRHRELATHICSERLVEKFAGQSGEMFKWTRVPGTRNHFLDCAVGCMVAAITEGAKYGNEEGEQGKGRQNRPAHRRTENNGGEAESGQRSARRRGGFRAVDD